MPDLKDIIPSMHLSAQVIERIIRRIEDNGEYTNILKRIASGDEVALQALDRMVQTISGPVWNLAHNPFPLKPDIRGKTERVVEHYHQHLKIVCRLSEEWKDRPFTKRANYQLWHPGRSALNCLEVGRDDMGKPDRTSLAGWRELLQFGKEYGDLIGRYTIVAGGSPNNDRLSEKMTFPCLRKRGEEKPEIAFTGSGRRRLDHKVFDSQHFFLIKVL